MVKMETKDLRETMEIRVLQDLKVSLGQWVLQDKKETLVMLGHQVLMVNQVLEVHLEQVVLPVQMGLQALQDLLERVVQLVRQGLQDRQDSQDLVDKPDQGVMLVTQEHLVRMDLMVSLEQLDSLVHLVVQVLKGLLEPLELLERWDLLAILVQLVTMDPKDREVQQV